VNVSRNKASPVSQGKYEKIDTRQGGRAGVLEKLYSDTFSRVNEKAQKPCNVGYPTWPMTLTSK
jgi:hypothetical protein